MRVTYRITGNTQYLVTVRGVTQRRRIKNVIATMPGESEPDRWVLLGNHVDAWVKVGMSCTNHALTMKALGLS